MVTWVNIPHNSRIILIRNFEKIFYILTWKTVRYFSMIGERTIGKYCPVRRMCWLHLYNPENFLIKSRQPVAQPVKIARAQLRSMQNIFSLKILNCSPMCWSLALAIKDWIHKSFFIRAIFSISTDFYCKICFLTLILCWRQVAPPHITPPHHHHHQRPPMKWVSLVSGPAQRVLTNFLSYYRTKPNESPSSSMFLNNDNNRVMTQLRINPQVLLWATRNSELLYFIIMVWKEEKVEFGPNIYYDL